MITMEIQAQTYSSKSTAIRGARRLKIEDPQIEQIESGRWAILLKKKSPEYVEQDATAEIPEPVAEEKVTYKATGLQPLPVLSQNNLSDPESIVPKRIGIVETYEDLTIIAPPKSLLRPTKIFIWAFLDLNPDLGRKEAISLLVKSGININTARTQYQLWHEFNKRE